MSKIFVIVNNGTAEVRSDTVPEGCTVEIIDFDSIRVGESFPSPEAFQYCREHSLFPDRRKKVTQIPDGRRETDPEISYQKGA